MAFELFKEAGTRTDEFISVTRTKSFGLSRAFLDKHNITPDHKAVIFYDASSMKVALHFTESDTKIGFSVRISNPKHGGAIKAKSFFDVKGINANKYVGRYSDIEEVELSDIGDFSKPGKAYVISLKESITASNQIEQVTSPVEPGEVVDEPINLDDIPFWGGNAYVKLLTHYHLGP